MLRHLSLSFCDIGMAPDSLLPALWQLESLYLMYADLMDVLLLGNWPELPGPTSLLSILPQLPGLTSLKMYHAHAPWPTLLRCDGLCELGIWCLAPTPVAPGSMLGLTRLFVVLGHAQSWPTSVTLPHLRNQADVSSRCHVSTPIAGRVVCWAVTL